MKMIKVIVLIKIDIFLIIAHSRIFKIKFISIEVISKIMINFLFL